MGKGNYSDQEVINGIKSQNSDVLLFVYRKNFRSVKHYIEKNNGSNQDAEDIFQDVMILIFDKINENSLILNCSLNTYLFSIVKLLWVKQLNFRGRKKTEIEDCDNFISGDDGILDAIMKTERKSIFLKHYNELSVDCQTIIKYFLRGHSISEITKTMGYSSEQHTKNRRFRCKKSLIEKILKNPYYKELTNGTIETDSQVPRW
jgi:RNA polymerase sigma factor (sigma-70 family)